MNLNEVIRFASLAISCFTESLAQLSRRGGLGHATQDATDLLTNGFGVAVWLHSGLPPSRNASIRKIRTST